MTTWDPTQYARFSGERTRPWHDLLAQVGARDPRLVVDLGCGNGPATLELAQRWPDARVVGVDSSPEMLAAAREADAAGRVEWVEADLRDWDMASLGAAPDVVLTNAALQWVPGHLSILPRWVDGLAPGGWFGMQVPGNFDSPTHALMRETAVAHPRRAQLEAAAKRLGAGDPATYLQLLSAPDRLVSAWETTYLHVLDREGEQDNPVLEWVRGTGLRPVLEILTDEAERDAFLADYGARLKAAYPRTGAGVILPFRRVFTVVHVPGTGV